MAKLKKLRRKDLKELIRDQRVDIGDLKDDNKRLVETMKRYGFDPDGVPHAYVIRRKTAELVFRRNGITDLHDTQRVLDMVERVLPDVEVPPLGWKNLAPHDDLELDGRKVRVTGSMTGGIYDMAYRDTGEHAFPSEGEGTMVPWNDRKLRYIGEYKPATTGAPESTPIADKEADNVIPPEEDDPVIHTIRKSGYIHPALHLDIGDDKGGITVTHTDHIHDLLREATKHGPQ